MSYTIEGSIGTWGIVCGLEVHAQGLPLGLLMIGRAWDESTVFRVGKAIEDVAGLAMLPYEFAGAA